MFFRHAVIGSLLMGLMQLSGLCVRAGTPASSAWFDFQTRAARVQLEAQRAPLVPTPPPEGVTDLEFRDFFARVIGERGLEYTERLRALSGQRVRILGHMVKEPTRPRGVFMLTPWPSKIENDGFCVSEDLPPATLHVLLPDPESKLPSPYIPGPLLLTGVLEVGPASTPDGRNSTVRLRLDRTDASTPTAASSARVSAVRQP